MIKQLFIISGVLFISVIFGSNLFAQNIEELQEEVNSYEIIRAGLTDSLSDIESKVDSLQDIIDQLNFKTLSEGGNEIKLKPNARIYEGDHVSTRVIAELPTGGTAIILKPEESNYIKVNYQGREGFVPRWNIEDESATAIRAEAQRISNLISSVEDDKRWIESNSANLRNGPSTDYDIIDQFERGKEVYIQTTDGNWLQVKYLEEYSDRELIQDEDDIESVYESGWLHESLLSNQYVAPISSFERQRMREEERTRQRRTQFVSNNPGLSEENEESILNGYISIGMTKDMVRASWGDPDDINRTTRANYTREQWIYGRTSNRKFIYFENDILTTIQD